MPLTAAEALNLVMEGESGVLLPEFTIGTVVLDLLAVDDRSLRGYEIKAATDRVTDRRFREQLRLYTEACEYLTYVVAPRFLAHCDDELPAWAGLTLIGDGGLEPLRPPQPNPESSSRRLVCMLWRAEAVVLLRERGLYEGVRRPCETEWPCDARDSHLAMGRKCRSGLALVLAAEVPEDELRLGVRRAIAGREWTNPRRVILRP